MRERAAELRAQAPADALVIEDIPLLVESGQAENFDAVIVVQAPHEERIRRMIQDRGWSAEEARSRMDAQATDEQRSAVADFVLDNSGTLEELRAQVNALYKQLT